MYLTQGDHPTLSILKASELMGHSVNVFLNTYSHVIEKNEQLDKIYDGVTDMLQVTQMWQEYRLISANIGDHDG